MSITTTARAIREQPDTLVRTIAERLAQGLANRERKPAHIVDDNGHLMLASSDDMGVYWWAEQIVFTAYPADPPVDNPDEDSTPDTEGPSPL